eukprot:SAG11_NODE_1949_length_4014_cov_2.806897_1_plen_68_part_00
MAALQAAELQRIGTDVALNGRLPGPVTELTELEEYTFDVGGETQWTQHTHSLANTHTHGDRPWTPPQ